MPSSGPYVQSDHKDCFASSKEIRRHRTWRSRPHDPGLLISGSSVRMHGPTVYSSCVHTDDHERIRNGGRCSFRVD